MMRVIKRYPNRKLYDTEAKQYVKLEGVAELIRQGEEVQVIDHVSGEDLTAVTLTQIIFEQEKKQSGFLPHSFLAGLIQAGGDPRAILQRTLNSSRQFWRQIDEEIKRRVQSLVSQGELTENEGRRLIEKLTQGLLSREEAGLSEERIERVLLERQTPTRADFKRLMEQIEALSASLEGGDPGSAEKAE